MTFKKELKRLINQYSIENQSDTPDYILANYLCDCLRAFDDALLARKKWYGSGRGPIFVDPPSNVDV